MYHGQCNQQSNIYCCIQSCETLLSFSCFSKHPLCSASLQFQLKFWCMLITCKIYWYHPIVISLSCLMFTKIIININSIIHQVTAVKLLFLLATSLIFRACSQQCLLNCLVTAKYRECLKYFWIVWQPLWVAYIEHVIGFPLSQYAFNNYIFSNYC